MDKERTESQSRGFAWFYFSIHELFGMQSRELNPGEYT